MLVLVSEVDPQALVLSKVSFCYIHLFLHHYTWARPSCHLHHCPQGDPLLFFVRSLLSYSAKGVLLPVGKKTNVKMDMELLRILKMCVEDYRGEYQDLEQLEAVSSALRRQCGSVKSSPNYKHYGPTSAGKLGDTAKSCVLRCKLEILSYRRNR